MAKKYDVYDGSGKIGEIREKLPLPLGLGIFGAILIGFLFFAHWYQNLSALIQLGIPICLTIIWFVQVYLGKPSRWVAIPLLFYCVFYGLVSIGMLLQGFERGQPSSVASGAALLALIIGIVISMFRVRNRQY